MMCSYAVVNNAASCESAHLLQDGLYEQANYGGFVTSDWVQISIGARKSKYVDHQSGVSARFSIANYRTMVASARHRGVRLGEKPAVPRISDLGHLYSSSLGKLELDMMGSHQMSERQVLEAIMAEADPHRVRGIRRQTRAGRDRRRLRQGREDRSRRHAAVVAICRTAQARAARPGTRRSRSIPASSPAVRASCIEFVLAGLYASDRISLPEHGRITYEISIQRQVIVSYRDSDS